MRKTDIDEQLDDLSLPAIPPLRHQETVLRQLFTPRRSSALVIWVVALPLYVIACSVMQTFFHSNLPLKASFDGIVGSLGPVMAVCILLLLPFAGLLAIARSSIHLARDATSQKRYCRVRLTALNFVLSILVIAVMLFYLSSILA